MGLPIGWTMPSCVDPWTIVPMNSDSSEMELFPTPQSALSESCGLLWGSPYASQRGDTLEVYLRKSINRLKKGKRPFKPELRASVVLAELGLSTSTVDLFSNLDLNQDIEELIKDILK